jgi:glycosyltransferase involved in cell wall biosynthesis
MLDGDGQCVSDTRTTAGQQPTRLSDDGCPMTLISIVIPAHNAESFLGPTLDSVIGQTHEEWECVVVDDSSDDATLDIAKQYARMDDRIRVMHVDHGGVSKARNAGFRNTNESAAYCTFMDSDDVWTSNALEDLLRAARADPSAIGAHGVGEFMDESGNLVEPGKFADQGLHRQTIVGNTLQAIPTTSPTDFSVLMSSGSVFPPGLLLIERQAYLTAGPFDESLDVGEDWEMLVRVTLGGHLAFLPEVILFYRRHDDNRSTRPDTPKLAHHAYCQMFHSPLNSIDQRAIARRAWRAAQREYISGYWAEVQSLGLRAPKESATYLARSAVAVERLMRGYPRPVVRKRRLHW